MADDRDASSIAQLEAQLRQAREWEAELLAEVAQCRVDLTQALEQQTATAEVLRVIASSPTHPHTVLDAIADSAVPLCGADRAAIRICREISSPL